MIPRDESEARPGVSAGKTAPMAPAPHFRSDLPAVAEAPGAITFTFRPAGVAAVVLCTLVLIVMSFLGGFVVAAAVLTLDRQAPLLSQSPLPDSNLSIFDLIRPQGSVTSNLPPLPDAEEPDLPTPIATVEATPPPEETEPVSSTQEGPADIPIPAETAGLTPSRPTMAGPASKSEPVSGQIPAIDRQQSTTPPPPAETAAEPQSAPDPIAPPPPAPDIASTRSGNRGGATIQTAALDRAPGAGDWMVQLGAFSEKPNADELIEKAGALGLSPRLLPPGSGRRLYLVQLGPFSDRAAAAREMRQITANGLQAFVLRNR